MIPQKLHVWEKYLSVVGQNALNQSEFSGGFNGDCIFFR